MLEVAAVPAANMAALIVLSRILDAVMDPVVRPTRLCYK
jgi:Na+/melibiose symporter-like transporter